MVSKGKQQGGLIDWLIQRGTAVLIGVYTVFLVGYLLAHVGATYATWHALFLNVWMKIFTVIVMLGILLHAWVGLWTVFTDYIKAKCLRVLLEFVVILLLVAYLVWLLDILWR